MPGYIRANGEAAFSFSEGLLLGLYKIAFMVDILYVVLYPYGDFLVSIFLF